MWGTLKIGMLWSVRTLFIQAWNIFLFAFLGQVALESTVLVLFVRAAMPRVERSVMIMNGTMIFLDDLLGKII